MKSSHTIFVLQVMYMVTANMPNKSCSWMGLLHQYMHMYVQYSLVLIHNILYKIIRLKIVDDYGEAVWGKTYVK